MITPRRTRLVEVADLPAFQRAIVGLSSATDPWEARQTAVIVSSRAAASVLRRTLENLLLPVAPALVVPHLLTRDAWYVAMHQHLPGAPPWLSDLEREVLAGRAARAAVAEGFVPPFRLHAGLIVEILAFYDALLRQRRTVEAFERLVADDLAARVDIDRGAERLLRQTRFLAALFHDLRAGIAGSGAVDEHALRDRLLAGEGASPFRHLVITVADQVAGRDGLWPADFDLITRVEGLEAIEVVATRRSLAAGLADRLAEWLPGIERETWPGRPGPPRACAIMAPASEPARLTWTSRDREEELIQIARWLKSSRLETGNTWLSPDPTMPGTDGERTPDPNAIRPPPDHETTASGARGIGRPWDPASAGFAADRTAVIFHRPLPYVYLAQAVFGAARIPHQTSGALPFASEPYAAAVDLVFDFVTSRFGRAEGASLLRSPHFVFRDAGGEPVSERACRLLERALAEAGVAGGRDEWARVVDGGLGADALGRAGLGLEAGATLTAAVKVAAGVVEELEPLGRSRPASAQIDVLLAFLTGHHCAGQVDAGVDERQLRVRAAILGALADLRAAHLRHDDAPLTGDGLAARFRRWMERQTFAPRRGPNGLHVLDAQAARYGDFDAAWLVGVIDGEWPERPAANVFYPPFLLSQLGWVRDRDALAAARASFDDLVRLPLRVGLSVFTLEDDAIVEPSPLLEELDRAGLEVVRVEAPRGLRVLADEALAMDPPRFDVLARDPARWADLRRRRGGREAARFHGQVNPAGRLSYSVSAIEEYLKCPFRYFARYVLKLPDETDDEVALAPRAQGQLLHEVLHAFYDEWQRAGHGAITLENLPAARASFRAVAEAALRGLPHPDAAVAELRLFGSPFAPGAGEIVARAEIERATPVVARLLEFRLDGACTLEGTGHTRVVLLHGVADRVDLLADGSLHVIDYKLGRPPGARYAVQLPVYAVHARQVLDGHLGRSWSIGDASYVSLTGSDRILSLSAHAKGLAHAISEGQARVIHAVEGIEQGRFPPQPAELFLCASCPYAAVCRKEYVGDDEPAPSL